MTDPLKKAIRRTYQQIRSALPATYQTKASKKICDRIQTLKTYRYAKRVALYQAINGEVNLNALWRSAPLQGRYCYFPALTHHKTLLFLPATPNTFGIAEPLVEEQYAITPDQLDIIFIPLLSFDQKGTRLGMGEGYYDRTLAQVRPRTLIGVAYEFQHQFFLEKAPWDIPLDIIVTEHTIYYK